jgi:hypothetical protein|eukprot:COSAG02_NODE_467_length_21771_cov_39.020303_8_plen_36_part_00
MGLIPRVESDGRSRNEDAVDVTKAGSVNSRSMNAY